MAIDDFPATTLTSGRVVLGGAPTAGRVDFIENGVFDEDWFAISLPYTARTYEFSVVSDLPGYPELSLYDSNGYGTGTWHYNTNSTSAITNDQVSTAGTYYLGVEFFSVGVFGTYTITARIVDDYGSDKNTNGSVTVGAAATGNIEIPTDSDWFKTTLEGGKTYTFAVNPVGGSLLDPWVQLIAGDGSSVSNQYQVTAGPGNSVLLTVQAPYSGVYYVDVYSATPSAAPNNTDFGYYVVSADVVGGSTVSTAQIQSDYAAIARTTLSSSQATSIADGINSGVQTEAQYIDGLIHSVANTTGAALLLHSFIQGVTPSSASLDGLTATAVSLINQAGGNPNGSWQQMGASLTDSYFNAAYLAKYASFGVPDLVDALYQDIYGSAPSTYAKGYFSNLVLYYANYFKHFTDAYDPTGYTRAEGTLIGDMLKEAMDISWGKYPAAEKAWLQAAANGTAVYGQDLLASHSSPAVQIVGTAATPDHLLSLN